MTNYTYFVRKYYVPYHETGDKNIAEVASSNERSAWLGVVDYAKSRKIMVRVFDQNNVYRGIVHPDGRTESCFGGH
jgi:hypothetical protein